jgi:signal peptidase I
MRGKYSPTVTAAYHKNSKWFKLYAGDSIYDKDGYDLYGYDKNDVDRAGHKEYEYYHNDAIDYGYDDDYNSAYESVSYAWGFDGTKPVLLSSV